MTRRIEIMLKYDNLKEFSISKVDIESDEVISDVRVKSQHQNDLDIVLEGIDRLIRTIEPKHMCDEDFSKYQDALTEILYMVADNLGFEGNAYFEGVYNVTYDENENPQVTDEDRKKLLKRFLDV